MNVQNIQTLRPFNEVSPNIQKLVLKAAKKREAFVWNEIEDHLKTKDRMNKADIKAIRLAMHSCFERAAVMIFDKRAEGADTWDTWLHYVRLAQTEMGFRLPEMSA